MEKIVGAVITRTLDHDTENASWRAYDTGAKRIAIVRGIEVEGTLIAGPGSEDDVKRVISALARRGELDGAELSYAVAATDRGCGPGYHLCDCLSGQYCCPHGKYCACGISVGCI